MEKIIVKYNEKVFRVGGSVRDELLGLDPEDQDFVIEQVTPEQFESDFPQYKRVGKDFPVYMVNGNEVALARVETKTGEKYQDYVVEAGRTIDEDLSRRDFTHGSLAVRVIDNAIIDPFNGYEDIKLKVLRAVNPKAFKEDPIRILRAARFIGRFDLVLDSYTRKLIEENTDALKNVTAERVTLEIEKSYKQLKHPGDFFRTLRSFGALVGPLKIFADMDLRYAGPFKHHGNDTILDHTLEAYDRAKEFGYPIHVAIAVLFHDVGKTITPECIYIPKRQHIGHDLRGADIIDDVIKQFRFDAHTVKLVKKTVAFHMKFHDLTKMRPLKLVELFDRIGKIDFAEVVKAANCDSEFSEEQFTIVKKLFAAFSKKVELPSTIKDGEKIKHFVKNFRIEAYKAEI